MVDSAKGHGFLCPACKVELMMSDRQGIEIDYCPQCRGVWLDRGELDKIIEKSTAETPQAAQQPMAPPTEPYGGYDRHGSKHGGYGRHGSGHHGSFLRKLFD